MQESNGLPIGWGDRANAVVPPMPVIPPKVTNAVSVGASTGSAKPPTKTTECHTAVNLANDIFSSWDQQYVVRWLAMVNLGDYSSVFSDQHIDGKALAVLYKISVEDKQLFYQMLESLPITSLGQSSSCRYNSPLTIWFRPYRS